MTNDDFPCCVSDAHEATINSELRVANAEIARLQGAIVEARKFFDDPDHDFDGIQHLLAILAKFNVQVLPEPDPEREEYEAYKAVNRGRLQAHAVQRIINRALDPEMED